jgi:hypothetical protein
MFHDKQMVSDVKSEMMTTACIFFIKEERDIHILIFDNGSVLVEFVTLNLKNDYVSKNECVCVCDKEREQ